MTKVKTLFWVMVLAILAALVPWQIVGPQHAQATITTPFQVLPEPASASANASYLILFKSDVALVANQTTIRVTFPSDTTVPSTIARTNITVGVWNEGADNACTLTPADDTAATPSAGPANPPEDAVIDGRTVSFKMPMTVNPDTGAANENVCVGVRFLLAAGIRNPTLADNYTLRVATADPAQAAVDSATYAITRSLSRTPTDGGRGTSITVTGVGWRPGTTVEVYRAAWGTPTPGTGVPPPPGFTLVGSDTVRTDGTFSVTVTASIPPFVAGPNDLEVRDGTGNWVGTDFTITPSLGTPAPTSGRAGAVVNVPARDFAVAPAQGNTTITVGGVVACNPAGPGTVCGIPGVGPAGNAPPGTAAPPTGNVQFVVPVGAALGDVQIEVTVGAQTARGTFRVVGADVVVTPSSVPNNTRVTISGSGFTPGSNIPVGSITVDGTPWNANAITIDGGGNFTVTLTWSTAGVAGESQALGALARTPATRRITVTDAAGRSGVTTVTVPARSIAPSVPSSGRGSVVTVTGRGFSANSTVQFRYGPSGTAADPLIAGVSASTDATGSFTAAITVPTNAAIPSTNLIRAEDTLDPPNIFAVAGHSIPDAVVELSSASGPPGSSLTVRGRGFAPFSQVRIAFGAAPGAPGATEIALVPAVITDATGGFSATVTVPGLPAGVSPVFAIAGDLDGVGGVTAADARSATFTIAERPTTIADVVAPISQQLVRIWGYDAATQAWRVYDPAAPTLSDLPALVRGQGYWVNVNADVTWVVAGNTYNLRRGWNLIGWLGP